MLRVGLTGEPGAGKSTVAALLAREGLPVVDADKVAHELYVPGGRLVAELGRVFGPEVVGTDGGIDRAVLGRQVFGHRDRLDVLNRIVHPQLLRELSRRFNDLEERGEPIGVLEAALLLQWGPPEFVNLVVAVEAPRDVRRRRLLGTGLAPDDTERRLDSHEGSPADMIDILITNDEDMESLEIEVRELVRELRTRALPEEE
jgi:dephospho-CoA kinase